MARTDRGFSLTLPVLKPNSTRFTITQAGFDVGSRTFTVDRDYLTQNLPDLELPDTSVRWSNGRSLFLGTYDLMFVSAVDISETTNNLVEFTVNYLGLILPNKRAYETASTGTTALTAEGFSQGAFYDSAPIVSLTSVVTAKPNPDQLGTEITPPGWSPTRHFVTLNGVVYPVPQYAKWILRERDHRRAGSLYEKTEQFVFEIVR